MHDRQVSERTPSCANEGLKHVPTQERLRVITTASDGVDVRAYDEGSGPSIVVLGPGLDDGTGWRKVATRLVDRYRVIRVHRRQYRTDLGNDAPCAVADEVRDTLAIHAAVGSPALLVGHSSGGVVALETMVAAPAAFAGAVIYEPPIRIDGVLGGEPLTRAEAALAAGKPGAALTIFLRDIGKLPPALARMASLVALSRKYRALIPPQLHDVRAIDDLGVRLDAYAEITTLIVLLGGERSPAHLGARLDALATCLPQAERIVVRRMGHDGNLKAPADIARVVGDLADTVLPSV